MNRLTPTLIATITSLLLLPAQTFIPSTSIAAAQQTPSRSEKLRQLAYAITVKVLVKNNSGSGTLIAKHGNIYTVLTNDHVLTPGVPYSIQTPDGKIYPASVVSVNSSLAANDLAILQFRADNDYTVASLDLSPPQVNQEVFAAGYPFYGKGLVLTSGRITLLPDKALQGGYKIGYSNDIRQGMSGGPLLNSEGGVIGVNAMHVNALFGDPYVFADGKHPSDALREQMRRSSWGVPIQTLAQLAPELAQAPIPKPNPEPQTGLVADVKKTAAEITVRINKPNTPCNGSGVIISKRGNTYTILTAEHVVRENEDCLTTQLAVVTNDGQSHQVDSNTVKVMEGLDVAVLQFTSDRSYQVATLADYNLETEERRYVFVYGWPASNSADRTSAKPQFTAGLIYSKERGIVSVKEPLISLTQGHELVYTNITAGGMSGGPVLDTRGYVVGIHAEVDGDSSYPIQLGYALGVPVGTFLSRAKEVNINSNDLKKETNAPLPLNEQETAAVGASLFNLTAPSTSANALDWINHCHQLWQVFQYSSAVKACDRAINIKSKYDQFAWYTKGLALIRQEQYEDAFAAFDKATQIAPEFREAWRDRSAALYYLNRYAEALDSIDEAIARKKDFFLYGLRGNVLGELKRYPEAIEAYTQSINIKPHSFVYYNRGYVRDEQGDKQGALADYTQAIAINPKDAQAYVNRGNVRDEQGDKQGALADYTQAIAINPKYAQAYYNRGYVRYEQGDVEAAINDWRETIALASNAPEPHLALGVALYAKGEREQGLKLGKEAIQMDKRYADIEQLKKLGWREPLLANAQAFLKAPEIQALIAEIRAVK